MEKQAILNLAVAVLLVMNVLSFSLMGADKRRARGGARRVPEKRLFLLALLGGAFGGWLGMYVFHHKTKHWYFKLGFPAIAIAQLVLIWLAGSKL